jgi:hypothetical protein
MNKTNPISSDYFLWLLLVIFALFIMILHLYLLMPGVDAGIYMYGSFLITKGLLPYEHLWNNKPPLIYLIGAVGFIIKSNPFLGVRIIELLVFTLDLVLINRIAKALRLTQPLIYSLSFCIIFLLCWDLGFLTEIFTVPLTLAAIYFFIIKTRFFEFHATLLLFLSFLLKQNAISIILAVILIDIFAGYRTDNRVKKIRNYILSLVLYLGTILLIIKYLGLWDDFVDQVFIYNSKHVVQLSIGTILLNQLKRNGFVSFRGFSLVMIFNFCLLLSLLRYWKRYKVKDSFQLKDRFFIASIVVYIITYLIVYV